MLAMLLVRGATLQGVRVVRQHEFDDRGSVSMSRHGKRSALTYMAARMTAKAPASMKGPNGMWCLRVTRPDASSAIPQAAASRVPMLAAVSTSFLN